MSSSQADLKELRRVIDGIDDNLLQLLTRRLEIVSQIGESRSNDSALTYVPAREAEIIRRLAARAQDKVPVGTVVRMWRELLCAAVLREGVFAVGAYVPPDGPGLWDIARDHYGSQMPMNVFQTTQQVIRAVTDRRVAAGVLPVPQDDDRDPWWVHLLSRDDDADAPRVIARLPFGPRGNARSDGDALVIGYSAQQRTVGGDRTLLATENAVDISHGRFADAFTAIGMKCTFSLSFGRGAAAKTLIEIDDFVAPADPRLDPVRERLGADLQRLLSVGSYALPLPGAAGNGFRG